MNRIKISAGGVTAVGELNDSPTAQAIWEALPITAKVNTWGQEINFSIPVGCEEEANGTELVQLGDLGYWPPGNGFCIFFGRTPVSRGNEIRAASAVNLIGKLEGDAKEFARVRSGAGINLTQAEQIIAPHMASSR